MNIASTALQIIIGLIFLLTGSLKLFTAKESLHSKGVTGFENIAPRLIKFLALAEIAGALILLIFSGVSFSKLLELIALGAFALLMLAATYHHLHRKEIRNFLTTLMLLIICLITFWLKWRII